MKVFLKYYLIVFSICGVRLFGQTATLPVELVYFNYQLVGSSVLLNWGTATEVNNYGFNVERYSGSTWYNIAFVQGSGTSNSPKYYSFKDTSVVTGNTYLYRLKQIDNTGDIKYSDTLVVSTMSGIKKIINTFPGNFYVSQNYPNPFNPVTNIKIELPQSSEIIFRVYDNLGKQLIENDYGITLPGVYTISFDGSRLSSGVYYYSVAAGQFYQARSMILLK